MKEAALEEQKLRHKQADAAQAIKDEQLEIQQNINILETMQIADKEDQVRKEADRFEKEKQELELKKLKLQKKME